MFNEVTIQTMSKLFKSQLHQLSSIFLFGPALKLKLFNSFFVKYLCNSNVVATCLDTL